MAEKFKSYDNLTRDQKLDLLDRATRILALKSPINPHDANDLLENVISFSKVLYERFPIPEGLGTVQVPIAR